MITLKRKKPVRKRIAKELINYNKFLHQDVTEIFIGKKTIFSLLGVILNPKTNSDKFPQILAVALRKNLAYTTA